MNNNELIALLPEMAIFVVVVEEEGFSRAGSKLGIATSSVSRSITRLEASLQTKLLERTTRQVRLNTVGAEVYEQCKNMLCSAKTATQAAESLVENDVGVVKIAAPKAFAKQVLTPMVLRFLEAYPRIEVQFKVADHFIDPISDEVDVIFRLTDQPVEGLVSKPLTRAQLVICASPQFVTKYGQPSHPDELANYSCISLGEKPKDRVWRLSNGSQTCAVETHGRFAANHTEIRKAAVIRNIGLSMFPDFTVVNELKDGRLIRLFEDWHVAGNYRGRAIMQFALSKYMPIQIRKFIDFIQHEFK